MNAVHSERRKKYGAAAQHAFHSGERDRVGRLKERVQLTIQEAGTQARVYTTAAILKGMQARERAKAEAVEDQIKFVRGRIKAIMSVLAFDHVGARCVTDDGIAYFDLVFPYYVELAHLTDAFAFDLASSMIRYHMPVLYREMGEDALSEEWARLTELRAIAQSRKDANPATQGKGYLYWLPTADTITRDLNLTRARRTAVNAAYIAHGDSFPIRGIGTVDEITPEEVRQGAKVRQIKCRRAKGIKPQSERNKTAEFMDLAAWRGCSLSTIKNRDKNGTLMAYLMGDC